MNEEIVWIFNEEGSKFPKAVFSDREVGDTWIRNNQKTGILTAYPVDRILPDTFLKAHEHYYKGLTGIAAIEKAEEDGADW